MKGGENSEKEVFAAFYGFHALEHPAFLGSGTRICLERLSGPAAPEIHMVIYADCVCTHLSLADNGVLLQTISRFDAGGETSGPAESGSTGATF